MLPQMANCEVSNISSLPKHLIWIQGINVSWLPSQKLCLSGTRCPQVLFLLHVNRYFKILHPFLFLGKLDTEKMHETELAFLISVFKESVLWKGDFKNRDLRIWFGVVKPFLLLAFPVIYKIAEVCRPRKQYCDHDLLIKSPPRKQPMGPSNDDEPFARDVIHKKIKISVYP